MFLRSPDRLLPRWLLQYQCRRSRHPCYLRKAHPRIFTIFSGTRQRFDHSQTGVPVYWAAPGRPLVPVRITLERSLRCRSGTWRRTGKLPRQGLGLRQSGALASPRALAATAARPPDALNRPALTGERSPAGLPKVADTCARRSTAGHTSTVPQNQSNMYHSNADLQSY